MTGPECSYELGTCKNKVKYWVRKKDANYWYPLCKDHLDLIIDNGEIERFELLQKEKARMHNQIIDWEELGYHGKIHTYDKAYGDIKLTMALNEYRKKKLQKYIDKRKKEHEDQIKMSEESKECTIEKSYLTLIGEADEFCSRQNSCKECKYYKEAER